MIAVPEAKPWPPPPDMESIRELVRAADPEGHLAEGAHKEKKTLSPEHLKQVAAPAQVAPGPAK